MAAKGLVLWAATAVVVAVLFLTLCRIEFGTPSYRYQTGDKVRRTDGQLGLVVDAFNRSGRRVYLVRFPENPASVVWETRFVRETDVSLVTRNDPAVP